MLQIAARFQASLVFVAVLVLTSTLHAADDTSRFNGPWKATFPFNGRMITMVSYHQGGVIRNFILLPSGPAQAEVATFSAVDGHYTTNSPAPNNAGAYRFLDDASVVIRNAAGQTLTWRRDPAFHLPANLQAVQPSSTQSTRVQPSPVPARSYAAQSPAPSPAAAPRGVAAYDPNESAELKAGDEAFMRHDYSTAWQNYMISAQKGNPDGEAKIGGLLFMHHNPPGTGYYAQCEKWLLASANQGNEHGMDLLAQYYYATGVATAGGINPGINNTLIPPALRAQAEERFALAREWYERAAARNDHYALGYLAIMLDAGIGGPADPARAAQLREQLKHQGGGPNAADPEFVKKVTTDPQARAMASAWQSGHYADAIAAARTRAAKGDPAAEALLGRAYYEGVGVPRNYPTALSFLNPAVAQNNADAMFVLGLMYEWGRGVPQNLQKALGLFDRAGALGQGFARIEAAGMRMEGEAAAQVQRYVSQCQRSGGIYNGMTCTRNGEMFDPY